MNNYYYETNVGVPAGYIAAGGSAAGGIAAGCIAARCIARLVALQGGPGFIYLLKKKVLTRPKLLGDNHRDLIEQVPHLKLTYSSGI